MSPPNNQENGLSVDLSDELSKNLTIHKNVNQEIIVTTSDKIKLVLIDTKAKLNSQRDWWTPFGLLISFITTMCTAEFKDIYGLTKDSWKAIFVILILFSGIWLLVTIRKLYLNWGKYNLDSIIEHIKLIESDNDEV